MSIGPNGATPKTQSRKLNRKAEGREGPSKRESGASRRVGKQRNETRRRGARESRTESKTRDVRGVEKGRLRRDERSKWKGGTRNDVGRTEGGAVDRLLFRSVVEVAT